MIKNQAKMTGRVIFKCRHCGKKWATNYDPAWLVYHFPSNRCECGKAAKFSIVTGIKSEEHKCDGRCQSATGPNCECQCGGENHGKNYAG